MLPVVGAVRRPVAPQEVAHGAFAWAGAVLLRAAVLHAGRRAGSSAPSSIVIASMLAGCSLVSYYAILVDISTEDERDRVSSRGWAFGYLGGGLLLAINLAVVPRPRHVRARARGWRSGSRCCRRRSGGPASRSSRWSGCATTRPHNVVRAEGGLFQRSFGQLFTTLKEMRGYPMTLTFLLAYLFYNDGIQTVIDAASTYGSKQLEFDQTRADRDDPADPVRRVRRCALLRPARGQARRLPVDPRGASSPGW